MIDRPRPERRSITDLLNAWAAGDPSLADAAFARVYDRLHLIAAAHLRRERRDAVLQTTGVLHEVYLTFSEPGDLRWRSRGHFFAFASRVMRRVLVEHARRRRRLKRGGGAIGVPLSVAAEAPGEARASRVDVLAVHEALEALEAVDPEKAQVVELRFFGGLSVAEAAASLGVSESTVLRRWRVARAWLFERLSRP